MKSTVEPLEGNKVKLQVEVDEADFEKAIDAAFRKIAREVRVPGFRPGKAPRRVLEARLGKGIGRTQALEDALPDYYLEAVREHEVDVIAAPEIDITGGQEDGQVTFDAVVEVRPTVTVPGYQNLRVTVDAPVATDEEIGNQLDSLRSRFAELETVDRAAVDTDTLTIDISGSHDGEELAGLTAEDFSYEVGSGVILPEVDEHLRGAKVGDILEFTAEHPNPETDEPIEFRVLVKEVKAKVLPDLDDDFASEASEFETMAELRDDLETRLTRAKKVRGGLQLREKLGEALADLVEEDAPQPLVDAEVRQRLQDLAMRLGAQGIDFATWLEATGQNQEDVVAELAGPALIAVKVDLALRAIAEDQGIECDDDELEAEFAAVAERVGLDVDEVRRQFERAGEVQAVRSDAKKRKAFDWLLERVEIVDEDGNTLDREAFEVPELDAEDDLAGATDDADDADDAGADTDDADTDSTEDDTE